MNLAFTLRAWEDYSYWQETDPQISKRIRQLIKDALRDPHHGIADPNRLNKLYKGAGRGESPPSTEWFIRSQRANC